MKATTPTPLTLLPTPLRKAAGLGAGEWLRLFRAQIAIIRWSVIRRIRPRGRLVRRAEETPKPASPRASHAPELERAREIALSLDRAARFGILRPKCLVRSLALDHLLRRDGLSRSRIRFGVRGRGGTFQAHAWVEFDGEVLADDPAHVASYAPVPELILAPGLE